MNLKAKKELMKKITIWKTKTGLNYQNSYWLNKDVNNQLINNYPGSILKRIIDIIISTFLLLIFSPLLIIIALLIKITSKGRIFFNWNIVGCDSKIIKSYKFRTMIKNAENIEFDLRNRKLNEMDNVYFKLKYDPRITSIGRMLRKFSLDELPSLFNVLKGDLSFVGPRPVRKHEYKQLNDWQKLRFTVKPGITSLWVVYGKNEIKNFNDIVETDLYYIEHASLLVDFKIIIKTILIVLLGRNY
jgi:lipopolysaccharide/colanic/teichoic acid biosynthesis glycosyltransferase|tara:strand:- start:339 stop:1070 length:732 start_codon:yes stop_codon:yes gene_type:complete